MDGVGTYSFETKDVIRNPLITKILKRYEVWE
jgi:phosphate starvation-inducible protein PhoH